MSRHCQEVVTPCKVLVPLRGAFTIPVQPVYRNGSVIVHRTLAVWAGGACPGARSWTVTDLDGGRLLCLARRKTDAIHLADTLQGITHWEQAAAIGEHDSVVRAALRDTQLWLSA